MQNWQITRTIYKVTDFLSWQKAGSLRLSPSFQRRPVWKNGAKSFLMDTICRNLPIPPLFLRELPSDLTSYEPKREVVDGQQRIRTVISFIAPELLEDYNHTREDFVISKTHNSSLSGKQFHSLDSKIQRRILDYQFVVHLFPSDTDDRDILQIFARMNSTGLALNAQELRNAQFYGNFKTLMYGLASEQLPNWRKWNLFTEYRIARMEEVELTSEIFKLMLDGIVAGTKSSLDNLYKKYEHEFLFEKEAKKRFQTTMDVIQDSFGNNIEIYFNRRPLFYALYSVVYDKLYGIGSSLEQAKPISFVSNDALNIVNSIIEIHEQRAPDEVLEAAARRTTHLSSRLKIINHLKKHL